MSKTPRFLLTVALSSIFSASFAQYPTIPDSVKARGAQESAVWDSLDNVAWEKALPEVMYGIEHSRPYIPWANTPDMLPQAPIPAFPGAQGGGRYSFGGRGGSAKSNVRSRVFVVTSLADSGKGTLREACEAGGPRVVVFNVAGEIHLDRPIHIRAPYITVFGQTAPGDGVVITGQTMEVDTHDVIIRYMRFRRGAMDVAFRDDACGGQGIGNIIYDHCSASWGLDEVMSMYRHVYDRDTDGPLRKYPTVNITIQDCIFAEGLDLYNHAFGASIGGHHSLFTRNLFANNISRNPSVAMHGDFNFVNNVLFNWWNRSIDGGDDQSEFYIVNNYFKPGPITGYDSKNTTVDKQLKLYKKGKTFSPEICYRILKPESSRNKDRKNVFGKAYVNGNYVVGNAQVTADNWNGGVQPAVEDVTATLQELRVNEPFAITKTIMGEPENCQQMMTAQEAYDYVLDNVGATLPKRDAVDERIIRGVRSGVPEYAKDAKVHVSPYSHRRLPDDTYKLGIITDPQQVGGLPEYKGEPRLDSDNDGMPDEWEKANGLNPNDASDATALAESGYMNIEVYANSIK